MGLDVAFNREQAIKAGLQLTVEANATAAAIREAEDNGEDSSYLEYLRGTSELVHIPGTEMMTSNDGLHDSIVVRANRWGRIHEPLTAWLQANDIQWSEF